MRHTTSGGIVHSALYDLSKPHAIIGDIAGSAFMHVTLISRQEAGLPWDEGSTGFCLKSQLFSCRAAVWYLADTIISALSRHVACLFKIPKLARGSFNHSLPVLCIWLTSTYSSDNVYQAFIPLFLELDTVLMPKELFTLYHCCYAEVMPWLTKSVMLQSVRNIPNKCPKLQMATSLTFTAVTFNQRLSFFIVEA